VLSVCLFVPQRRPWAVRTRRQTLEDFPVPPGSNDVDGFQTLVGITGTGTVPAFALTYRLGRVRYVALIGHGAMLCAKACEGQEAAEADLRAFLADLAAFVDPPPR
jgi:hypothetical protein